MTLIRRLFKEEEGQGIVEYALVIAVISLLAIATGPTLVAAIQTAFTKISNKINNPTT
ncbi:Flp family type IVb pilin [Anaerobium acetethylicum]|uniref:Pilus assembly protein Flp/PilA n=1 Tax=Anaerobium acetethylicum TaxID=1619234 RepID=A0A1D3TV69_9FIRM|nr:Flp family type IVb pilin [Anaerobium acetethylicum]SCP98028.1 pilus assembly protein Flp/PilA [Anaerobium acetethylicum]